MPMNTGENVRGLGMFNSPTGSAGKIFDRQADIHRRELDPVPDIIQQVSADRQYYIFNVGPKPHQQLVGSAAPGGVFWIPQCYDVGDPNIPSKSLIKNGDGEFEEVPYMGKPGDYSAPLITPGIPGEYMPSDEKRMKFVMHGRRGMKDTGKDFAENIVGIGRHQSPTNSLVKVGVAVSDCWPPKAETLAAAKKEFFASCDRLISEADDAHKLAKSGVISEDHFRAARIRKRSPIQSPWLNNDFVSSERGKEPVECQWCGAVNKPEKPICYHCGKTIDQELFDKIEAEQKDRKKAKKDVN